MSAFGDAFVHLNDPFNWTRTGGILDLLVEHLRISALAVLLGALIALPVGVLLGTTGRGGSAIVVLSNVSRAVPTLALLTVFAVTPLGFSETATILALAVFAFPPINGARRWIRVAGFFSVQPSELAKLALAVFLARFLERRAGEEGIFWGTFFPSVAVAAGIAVLVVAEPDLGTAMMLVVICVTVLYTAGARLRHLALAAAPALVALAALLVFVPWRMKRLITFLDPWADPQGAGYQVVQSLLAVGSGGVNGLGFTEGRQKLFFLPFPHSDFIFAVVGEELGLLGGLGVVALFALFLWRGMRAALRAPDRFGMLLGVGVVTGVVAQALFNISVVLSLVPTKGIPLPFISYGGSSLVPTLFSVGVLLNISQQGSAGRDFGFSSFDVRLREEAAAGARGSNRKSKVENQKFA